MQAGFALIKVLLKAQQFGSRWRILSRSTTPYSSLVVRRLTSLFGGSRKCAMCWVILDVAARCPHFKFALGLPDGVQLCLPWCPAIWQLSAGAEERMRQAAAALYVRLCLCTYWTSQRNSKGRGRSSRVMRGSGGSWVSES